MLALAVVAGCGGPERRTLTPTSQRATAPLDPRATLTLDQIEPIPKLPTVQRDEPDPPPLEALRLYAQARRLLIENQRFTAIKLLEQVIALDPLTPAPYVLLADATLGDGTFNDRSIDALETVVKLDSDDTSARLALGRQYLAKGDLTKAMLQLRLALQTPGYELYEDDAALADLLLAKTLQRAGYETAAVQQYELLLARLRTRDISLRKDPELTILVSKPELVSIEIGKLYESRGDPERALAALEPVAVADPNNFDLQALVTRMTYTVGRKEEAVAQAASLVSQFRASAASIELLQDVTRGEGKGGDAVAHLRRLHGAKPNDRAVLFALSETLRADGKGVEATKLLVDALGQQSADVEITRRLFTIYDGRDEVTAAARLIINTAVRQPDATGELLPLWNELARTSRPGRLRAGDVEQLNVPPTAEAARLFFLANCPDVIRRPVVERSTLEKAVKLAPSFSPAFRQLYNVIWDDPKLARSAKIVAIDDLIATADRQNDPALAAELQGVTLLKDGDANGAVRALVTAMKLGPGSPDRILTAATAHEQTGNAERAEQLLWKLISDRPTTEAAYGALFTHYLQAGESTAAIKVLSTWLSNDPTNVSARLLQASVFRQAGQPDAAERVLVGLVEEQPRNYRVLVDLYLYYARTGQFDPLVGKLEELRTRDASNRAAAETLVEVYAEQGRLTDAARVLDSLRASSPREKIDDADLLYYYSGHYTRIGQTDTAEQLLEQAVTLDPSHASASNDLGYFWADAGRNLERAEAMVRVAVDAEPDNASFLDSLGWVLYKRGKFADAERFLAKAASVEEVDPVVLDHLGDTQYRMKQLDGAQQAWQKSLDRINAQPQLRDDLKELKLKLMMKLKQSASGQPVSVAPIATSNGRPAAVMKSNR